MVKLRLIEGGREKLRETRGEIDTVNYTNRKGRKYYLFQSKTKTGKTRYVFRRTMEGQGQAVPKIPSE